MAGAALVVFLVILFLIAEAGLTDLLLEGLLVPFLAEVFFLATLVDLFTVGFFGIF